MTNTKYEQLVEIVRKDAFNNIFDTSNEMLKPLMIINQYGKVGFLPDGKLYVSRCNTRLRYGEPQIISESDEELIDYLLWASKYENPWSSFTSEYNYPMFRSKAELIKFYTYACLTYFHKGSNIRECDTLWKLLEDYIREVRKSNVPTPEEIYNNTDLIYSVKQTLSNALGIWPNAGTHYNVVLFIKQLLIHFEEYLTHRWSNKDYVLGDEGTTLIQEYTKEFMKKYPVKLNTPEGFESYVSQCEDRSKRHLDEKQVFLSFKAVQTSGEVSMFDRVTVCELAKITADEYKYVVRNYKELNKKYKGESL